MNVKIIAVGKLKEKYLKQGIQEYLKRLGAYCKMEIIEVNDEPIGDNASQKDQNIVKQKEGAKILNRIKDNEYVILLHVDGEAIDSVDLADKIETLMINGKSSITFVIGGSLGHGEDVLKRADYKLSFSKMTMPHQLIRLVLVEQIYRAFKIIRKETYHK
ncbi:MAG: 23S rRNA (pseudouridine(1915)-N(3))-methyltransferase RlmH [Erysipelotrichaceae bacterium]|nr:23S rRNA (pseudouridine(1915)-N(3))-methyltransferase RlmH [Erysipelotrichaceae bacterium]MDD3808927.1 23S rRNA (pseudouridine(1915)-N(3))-methyltransferase RlmH [Erysipelotrichaceae bacterium]